MSLITEQCKTLAKVQLVSAYNMVGQVIKFTSESMTAFARFSSLKELSLSRLPELTDSSLRHIVELPIEKLSLGGCSGLTLDAMHHLVALRRLKDLNLYRMNIGDEGFKILTNCKTLQSLTLEGGDMTDAGLKMFSSPTSGPAKTLVNLRISSVRAITNEGIAHLANGFKNLQTLWLEDRGIDCLVTGGCLRHIGQGLLRLKKLTVCLKNARDDDLQPLHGLKHLISFEIRYSNAFTGCGLSYLRDIPTLRELDIGSKAFTAEGLASLQFLPKLKYLCVDDVKNRAVTLLIEMMAHINQLTSLKHLCWQDRDLHGREGMEFLDAEGCRRSGWPPRLGIHVEKLEAP